MIDQDLAARQRYHDLSRVLATDEGVRMLAEELRGLRVLSSVYQQNAGIYRDAGLQAHGLRLFRDVYEASPAAARRLFDLLMQPGKGPDYVGNDTH